jgi:hypothetical protein
MHYESWFSVLLGNASFKDDLETGLKLYAVSSREMIARDYDILAVYSSHHTFCCLS